MADVSRGWALPAAAPRGAFWRGPAGELFPASLLAGSNGGRGGTGGGLRKEGGGDGENDHPPQAGTKGRGFRAGWRPRLGSRAAGQGGGK